MGGGEGVQSALTLLHLLKVIMRRFKLWEPSNLRLLGKGRFHYTNYIYNRVEYNN